MAWRKVGNGHCSLSDDFTFLSFYFEDALIVRASHSMPAQVALVSAATVVSIDWFKGKITGKSHIPWENLWFPLDFPFI